MRGKLLVLWKPALQLEPVQNNVLTKRVFYQFLLVEYETFEGFVQNKTDPK